MRSCWIFRTVALLILCKVVLSRTLGGAPVSVHPITRRLVDEYFREVYFHGVNVVVKGFPWIPDTEHWSPETSFSQKDWEVLQELGLNGIRLGTMWPGAEPSKGQFNMSYLEALYSLVKRAAEYDIYSLLDMHQDVLSEKFCGEGVPFWAAAPANDSDFPIPVGPAFPNISRNGVPTHEECWSHDWPVYYASKAAGSAFQNLYSNNFGLRDAWANFWKTVAEYMKPLGSAVLGYELMNEPWAGDVVQDILLIVPGVADMVNLQQMWEAGAAAIRSVDTDHAIWFEGVTWDWFGVGFTQVPGGDAWRNKSVLSYHFYTPPDFNLDTQFAARLSDMQRLGCGGFLTEFSMDASVMDKCDDIAQGWMIWEYKPFLHNRTGWSSSIWFSNGSMDVAAASTLSRTYAQVVAGTLKVMRYSSADYSFILIFAGDPLVTANTTTIYLNEDLHYPRGFTVTTVSTAGNGTVTWRHASRNYIEVQHSLLKVGTGLVTVEIVAM